MADLWKGEVTVVSHGKKAMKVSYENEDAWIPYSQVHDDSTVYEKTDPGETEELVIPLWLAEAKGWEK